MIKRILLSLFFTVPGLFAADAPKPAPAAKAAPVSNPMKWLWHTGSNVGDGANLKKEFEVEDAASLKSAILRATCDNGAKIFLNGELVLTNPDWMEPSQAEVKAKLRPGKNEVRVEATNKGGAAGFIASLKLTMKDGKEQTILTDASWLAALPGTTDYKPARVVGDYGAGPWGQALDGKPGGGNSGPAESISAADITVPKGFTVEKLYNVPKEEEGSWVALAVDPKGRLIVCDQYGSIYRMSVPAIGKTETLKPEKLAVPAIEVPGNPTPTTASIGKAHGLLHAFDSLYVMVNEDGKNNGLYRLHDTNGDDQYDKIDKLQTIAGGGEHGLHSMVVSPDGKRIVFNCGNASKLPDGLSKSRGTMMWGDDHVVPRMWDANGFMRGYVGAGGYICSMNPDGSDLELFCHGFRNEFDIAFDLGGQLFTYDADMEWDLGTPWYRPTRVNHCVSGADYGWRAGSGKWPDYYPDTLPTTIDIGPGSPTGVVSGSGAKFPAKYQRAVFINDWTYGTMWAVHLQPDGASYRAEKEEFVFGKPLPLTDVVISPQDGAMYFAVGGRRTQSGVYRVTYTGAESTAPAEALPLPEGFQTRAMLEELHTDGVDPQKALATAWPHLSHGDRHIRYAARVAIERLPVELWKDKAINETNPDALTEAIIALARAHRATPVAQPAPPVGADGKPVAATSSPGIAPVRPEQVELQNQIFNALAGLEMKKLTINQQLAALRACQLVLTRLGKPDAATCAQIAERLESDFPTANPFVNRELVQILVAIDSTRVVSQTLALMATARDDFSDYASDEVLKRNDGYATAARAAAGSRPNAQQISYMFALRSATAGWTPENRRTYFSWFPRARTWKGGNSFKGFIDNIRKEALATFVPHEEYAALDVLSTKSETDSIPNYVAPKGPGKNYTLDETVALATGNLKGRDFANGEAMYRSVICATCHRFNGDGGSIGPDLTGAGNRYTLRDLMENIIDPSKVISDQYDSHQITMKDGSTVLGRIVVEENGKVFVMANPFAPNDQMAINESDIVKKETRKISMMPPSLINALNQDELLNLIAYLLSGGDANSEMFKP